MVTKVKELDNRKQGDRNACQICRPRRDRISESDLWKWAMTQEGPVWPWRDGAD